MQDYESQPICSRRDLLRTSPESSEDGMKINYTARFPIHSSALSRGEGKKNINNKEN